MSTIKRITKTAADESGVALVEFALIVPLLILILFAILDFGRAFNYWNDETHLANEGARFAAVNKSFGTQSLQDHIAAQADSSELKNGSSSITTPLQVCVSFPDTTSKVGDPVQVKVTATYHFLGALHLPTPSKTISATSTMRLEQVPTSYSANPC
jgi:Flp pilus assembly protein TadG